VPPSKAPPKPPTGNRLRRFLVRPGTAEACLTGESFCPYAPRRDDFRGKRTLAGEARCRAASRGGSTFCSAAAHSRSVSRRIRRSLDGVS